MEILIQILIAVALVALVVWLTAVYWHRVIRKMNTSNKALSDQQNIDRMKDRAASHKQTKALKSKVDLMTDVLLEVQRQHEGMTSYMEMLTSAELQPSQKEWKQVCDHLKERSGWLTEMVNSTLELLPYEDMSELEQKDTVHVNGFCLDIFDSCKKYLQGNVDLRFETELNDDAAITTNLKALQRVLTELLVCSMQFTHEGEIVLGVKRHQHNEESYLMFTISDTGLGIPEVAKDLAFEQMSGTEIDSNVVVVRLRLCKAIVKLLGGSIYLNPAHEEGTSVVFTIKS